MAFPFFDDIHSVLLVPPSIRSFVRSSVLCCRYICRCYNCRCAFYNLLYHFKLTGSYPREFRLTSPKLRWTSHVNFASTVFVCVCVVCVCKLMKKTRTQSHTHIHTKKNNAKKPNDSSHFLYIRVSFYVHLSIVIATTSWWTHSFGLIINIVILLLLLLMWLKSAAQNVSIEWERIRDVWKANRSAWKSVLNNVLHWLTDR